MLTKIVAPAISPHNPQIAPIAPNNELKRPKFGVIELIDLAKNYPNKPSPNKKIPSMDM